MATERLGKPFDPIEGDFEVDKVWEGETLSMYAAPKGGLLHFVFVTRSESDGLDCCSTSRPRPRKSLDGTGCPATPPPSAPGAMGCGCSRWKAPGLGTLASGSARPCGLHRRRRVSAPARVASGLARGPISGVRTGTPL